jgi:AbrB family looped-hinge helix DNA binding protein
MTYAHVSPKFQIVIPKEIRKRIALRPRQRLIVVEKGGIIHLVPELSLKSLKGILSDSGISSTGLRDKKDRL